MPRTVEPEILDSLPPHHPDALHNRRDLRVTNFLMGNHRWLARTLPRVMQPHERALELGAGTGELMQRLGRDGLRVDGLDRWPKPAGLPAEVRWHSADLREFDGYADYPVIFGNLIFHQFTDEELQQLGAVLRRHARVIVACEPLRSSLSQKMYRLAGPLFGANHVSLHDAHVSIAAGFLGTELADALGLSPNEWQLECQAAPIGAYHLVAVRRA